MNLAKILVATTGLVSAELRYFYSLMDLYQEEKFLYLNKPIDENIFLKFLESGTEYAPKLIIFISRLVDRFYSKIMNPEKPVTDESQECYYNIDYVLKTFLQNDVIYSVMAFFSKVIADCQKIRDALYEKVAVEKDEDAMLATNMLTLLYTTASLLQPIVLNKTFMDYEYQIVSEKYLSLTALFKNICENNCQKFKMHLGTFAPTIAGIPILNKARKPLVYDAYVRLESAYTSFNVHTNKDAMLRVDDKPELLPFMSNWIKMVTECINGPCLHNQKQIYIYRTDAYTGTIKRMVDNVESTFYHHKNVVTEYVDGLLEGNDPEIMKHFASNFTFDIMFNLICNSIKRLYIYCLVQGDQKKYVKLVKEAKAHHQKLNQEKRKNEMASKDLLDRDLEFYNSSVWHEEGSVKKVDAIEVHTQQGEQPTVAEEFMDPRIISQEILDYVKVEDYKDIMDLYLRSDKFSKHVILSTVFKLNDFMNRFTTTVAGYKICLENVYNHLVDIYGDEVPVYIINKLGNYERKGNREKDEKLVLYMFLCKITSEIELMNPANNRLVKVCFPLIPKTFFLTKVTKNNLIYNADAVQMTMDLVIGYTKLDIEMNYNVKLFRSQPIIYFLSSDETFYQVKFVLWCLAFILNLIMIVFYRRDSDHSWIIREGEITLWAIAALIIFLSFAFTCLWFYSQYPQKILITKADRAESDHQAIENSKVKRFYKLYIRDTILMQVYPILFSYYTICCLLGIFVQPFFFTLMLLMIVSLSTTMNYVVKAITTHIDQLALTVILMTLVMYCYAMLSAEYFFDKLESNQPGNQFYNCTQLWECLTYVFNFGLRNGGGIGDVSVAVNPLEAEGIYMGKFFFDVAFFFLVNVISLNIIFGIIIDTFADMREKNDEKELALASNCMVCLRERTSLMKEGKSFKQHIDHDHGFWKYSDYLAYLNSKDKADQTGFENVVWENYSSKQVGWIPFKDIDPNAPTPKEVEELEEKKKKDEEEFKTLVKEKFDLLEKKLTEAVDQMAKSNSALTQNAQPAPAPTTS